MTECSHTYEAASNSSVYDSVSVAAENVVGVGAARTCAAQPISEFVDNQYSVILFHLFVLLFHNHWQTCMYTETVGLQPVFLSFLCTPLAGIFTRQMLGATYIRLLLAGDHSPLSFTLPSMVF